MKRTISKMSAVILAAACMLCAGATIGASFGLSESLTVIPYPQQVTLQDDVFVLPTNRIEKTDVIWKRDAAIPSEGYRLSVTPTGITVWSSDDAGAFYALQTLRQLERPRGVPCCEIEDAPKFPWRGFMLDEARHFFGKETVKRHLDLMARVKLNVFHWHLTDDEGWRIELKRHPEVHEKVKPRGQTPGRTSFLPRFCSDLARYLPRGGRETMQSHLWSRL